MPNVLRLEPLRCVAKGCDAQAFNMVCWRRMWRGKLVTKAAAVCDSCLPTALAAATAEEEKVKDEAHE
jgi:hypothetical protein